MFRRLNITAEDMSEDDGTLQFDMFTDYEAQSKENDLQYAMQGIRSRFGKNAVVKGFNLLEGATAIERNSQIGGHRA